MPLSHSRVTQLPHHTLLFPLLPELFSRGEHPSKFRTPKILHEFHHTTPIHPYPQIQYTETYTMAGKKGGGGGEGSKKAQGQARKADAAASKQAAKNQEAEKVEADKWEKGAKSNAKAYVNHLYLFLLG